MNILKTMANTFEGKFPKRPSFAKSEYEHGEHKQEAEEPNIDISEANLDNDVVGLTVGVEYKDEDNNHSKRWVSIINFANSFAGYHSIRGYCFMSEDVRSFRLDRVVNLFNENNEPYDLRDLLIHAEKKQPKKPPYRSIIETKNWNILRDTLRVLIAVARSDGYLHPKEVQIIVKYIESEAEKFGYPLSENDSAHLHDYINRQQPSGEIISSCLNRLAEQDNATQDKLLEYLLKTIYADGILAPEEVEISAEVYRRFNK